jgi:RimJ/RimL family protein N-acetyltransferase
MALSDFLLRTAGLRKITAGTLSVNAPMLRLMDRVGMVPDGRRARHQLWEGQEVDIVHAALFRDGWLQRFPVAPTGLAPGQR